MKINWTYPTPIKGSDYANGDVFSACKNWWDFLKTLWRKYKCAKLNDNYQLQFNSAMAIKIVQKDGGCKISSFPEFEDIKC